MLLAAPREATCEREAIAVERELLERTRLEARVRDELVADAPARDPRGDVGREDRDVAIRLRLIAALEDGVAEDADARGP